jgi:hypothetical protein
MNNQDLSPASLPSLPSSLSISYQSLTIDMQRLFIKVFKYLYSVAHIRRYNDAGGLLLSWWAVDIVRARSSLSGSEFAILTYIYQMSNKGAKVLHSDNVYFGPVVPDLKRTAKMGVLCSLVRSGYLSRSTRNHQDPFYSRSVCSHPVYITLTCAGVKVIEDIEKDLYKLLLRSSLDDLTGKHKKT